MSSLEEFLQDTMGLYNEPFLAPNPSLAILHLNKKGSALWETEF